MGYVITHARTLKFAIRKLSSLAPIQSHHISPFTIRLIRAVLSASQRVNECEFNEFIALIYFECFWSLATKVICGIFARVMTILRIYIQLMALSWLFRRGFVDHSFVISDDSLCIANKIFAETMILSDSAPKTFSLLPKAEKKEDGNNSCCFCLKIQFLTQSFIFASISVRRRNSPIAFITVRLCRIRCCSPCVATIWRSICGKTTQLIQIPSDVFSAR